MLGLGAWPGLQNLIQDVLGIVDGSWEFVDGAHAIVDGDDDARQVASHLCAEWGLL